MPVAISLLKWQPKLGPPERSRVLREALEAMQALGDGRKTRAEALAVLAPQLTADSLAEGLEAVWVVSDEDARTRALADLARFLVEVGCPVQALEAAWRIEEVDARTQVLADLARRLAELGHPDQALEAARAIE